MSYKFSFADNTTYGAADINAITQRLVTSGIEDSFTDGVAYNVSKFNEAGKLLYTSGVVPENCLTLKVSKVSDTEILINPGKAFFNDGAVIEIEAGGETLSYVKGAKNYVYLKNELVDKNICYPVCTTEAPTGDYVLLAEIDESGIISDKRTYAKGKLPGYQSVAGNVMVIDDWIQIIKEGTNLIASASYDIGDNNFEYILAISEEHDSIIDYYDVLGIYNISQNTYISFAVWTASKNIHSNTEMYLYRGYNKDVKGTFSLNNGILTLDMVASDGTPSYGGLEETPFNLKLILF